MRYERTEPKAFSEALQLLKANPQGLAVFEISAISNMPLSDRQWRHVMDRMLSDEAVIVVKRSRNFVRYHHPDIPLRVDQLPPQVKPKKKEKECAYDSDAVCGGAFNPKESFVVGLSREFMSCIAPVRAARGHHAAL